MIIERLSSQIETKRDISLKESEEIKAILKCLPCENLEQRTSLLKNLTKVYMHLGGGAAMLSNQASKDKINFSKFEARLKSSAYFVSETDDDFYI